MIRMVNWLQHRENRLFLRLNRRTRYGAADWALRRMTHLGGATFGIAATVALIFFSPQPWSAAALASLIALAASHVPVAILKRVYPRLRPYLVIPEANTCAKPLRDHSFPSGHTTAIFSIVVPFVLTAPPLGLALLPVAAIVAYSRIYLGLHYPSDCAVGALIGTIAATLTVAYMG